MTTYLEFICCVIFTLLPIFLVVAIIAFIKDFYVFKKNGRNRKRNNEQFDDEDE